MAKLGCFVHGEHFQRNIILENNVAAYPGEKTFHILHWESNLLYQKYWTRLKMGQSVWHALLDHQ
jgi:hypothetical protein